MNLSASRGTFQPILNALKEMLSAHEYIYEATLAATSPQFKFNKFQQIVIGNLLAWLRDAIR